MEFWKHVLLKLYANQKVYLLTVIENSGSSPGRKGFKMMVAGDGFIFGSIGGGVMEFSLVEEVKKRLKQEQFSISFKKQLHKGTAKNSSGMICSGEQTVVFHPLNKFSIPEIEAILDAIKNNLDKVLILSPNAIQFTNEQIKAKFETQIISNENWVYKEQVGRKSKLYIIGGGHVSFAVSKLFVELGFYVVVLDNREALNTLKLNSSAHEKQVIDFNAIENYVPKKPNSYIAIMTNKFVDDKIVLKKLINNNYTYIGVLGSKAKLKIMWKMLLEEGISEELLNKVHAPIGISIKSQTPVEIAVSIAAEIIQEMNANK